MSPDHRSAPGAVGGPTRRSGRRPGDSGTREQILASARDLFGATGYAATTIRAVAKQANVDPALVHHYFGTKSGLFAAALQLPADPAELMAGVVAHGPQGLGERVIRTFLDIWDGTPGQGPLLALLRSAVASEPAAALLRDVLGEVFVRPLTEAASPDRSALRASLVASQMVGLAVARYVVRLEPLASAAPDELAPALGATVDHYLLGPLDRPGNP